MSRAFAVVGANWGDEGKGLVTDYLCDREQATLVVRFNGGSQAGHTVVRPDGQRFIFSHFGSGTALGVPTFLSRFFVVNPFAWAQELKDLQARGVNPQLWVDANCPVATPFDVLINQLAEAYRGEERHGSCGAGINETIERNERFRPLLVADLFRTRTDLAAMFRFIAQEWVPQRFAELCPGEEHGRFPIPERMMEAFLEACNHFVSGVTTCSLSTLPSHMTERAVFEGAQGLMLDEGSRFFPHVTRSRTGLPNVVELVNELGLKDLSVYYVTRAYMTRHGAGPFPSEVGGLSYPDETNVPNPHQGDLRFGRLDARLMNEFIMADLRTTSGLTSVEEVPAWLAVTCMDQVEDKDLVMQQLKSVRIPTGLMSFGPRRLDVMRWSSDG